MSKHSLFTSNFKSNIKFIGKLFFMVILIAGYINWVLPQYKNGYNAFLLDKVNRLESIEGPKIVLIGNSNVAFGINSELIEEAFGVPVVNMGLHGGVGNAFHEEMAKFNVAPGDLYIICHSSFGDSDLIDDTMAAWTSIENNYSLWRILRISDIENMARSFPVYLKKSLALYSSGTGNQDSGGVYARSAFNEYGDVAYKRIGRFPFTEGVGAAGISDVAVNRINKLNDYFKARGAVLLVAGYPIASGNLSVDATDFINLQNQLVERLDCPVISNYVDYMFDYNYFHDTNLHLNTVGANLRTVQLISDIQRWKDSGTDASIEEDIYEDIVADVNLSHITNIYEYLSALEAAKNRYSIFISVKDDASSFIDNEILQRLQSLGLEADLADRIGYSYLGVIEQGTVLCEKTENEKIQWEGTVDEGRISCLVVSGGYNRGGVSSIILNEEDYSEDMGGLNFVVYSNETHRILDEVTFDTGSAECTVTR